MAFNEEQFVRDILGATGGKVTIEKGTLNKSFEEMKEDLEKVFKPREPLFTLTAEEVTIVEHFLTCDKMQLETYESSQENDIMIADLNYILNKIKDYRNGH